MIDILINRLEGIQYIELCGPYGCGKTVTLLKFINCQNRRAYYINLWTVYNLEIQELRNVLKYEYVKLIDKDYKEENENDAIISSIKNLNSSQQIFDFILEIIPILKIYNEIIYLVVDQYSSKYDEQNTKIKEIKNKIINTDYNIKLIVCSSMNNYDVKENLAYSLSFSNNKDDTNLNYYYVGCLFRLDPNKEPLINESTEFKNILTKFGNLPFFYYKLKKTYRDKIEIEIFLKIEKKI